MKWWIYIALLLNICRCFAQKEDYSWWNKKHNWDGYSSWTQYITTSPGLMGPNALPVPDLKGGMISDSAFINFKYAQHGGYGDNTRNAFIDIYIPVLKNKIAFNAWMVPLEYYKYDTITRDERKARHIEGKGYAVGDLYFSSLIKLITEKKVLPATVFECAIKTASGTGLSNARYTDTPGYIFTIHTSKTLFKKEKYVYYLNTNTGFYSWQTNKLEHRQNDAFVYGLSFSMIHPLFSFNTGIKGYYGYLNDGDRPNVVFAKGTKSFGQTSLNLELQYGLSDFPYQSVLIGLSYYPPIVKKLLSKYQSSGHD
jgi:hypothetical protein